MSLLALVGGLNVWGWVGLRRCGKQGEHHLLDDLRDS
jgi:hypothetical protein